MTAYPTTIKLYCGYAYESALISETFQTALLAMLALLLTLPLLFAFVRNNDWSILCLALVAFVWMVQLLWGTSFFYQYFPSTSNSATITIPLSFVGIALSWALEFASRGELVSPLTFT